VNSPAQVGMVGCGVISRAYESVKETAAGIGAAVTSVLPGRGDEGGGTGSTDNGGNDEGPAGGGPSL